MRQIDQAILHYSDGHGGRYPDSLGELLLTEDVADALFICPSTNDAPSTAPTTQAQADDVHAGRNVSYRYLGKGMNSHTVQDTTVVVYEPLANHKSAGMHVLFGDGHVEFIGKVGAAAILAEVNAGTSPVRYPDTQPTQ